MIEWWQPLAGVAWLVATIGVGYWTSRLLLKWWGDSD